MGYRLKVESYFSAAHRLRGYHGKCENLHGHNWKVEISIISDRLDKAGMVLDFKKIKAMLNRVLNDLDHQELNKIAHFKKHNPTSELIAEYIFTKCSRKLKSPLVLESTSVWETPNSCAVYYKTPDDK
jgi:6-pyruvoyltetrahydropterin/6-carboxytetrahydropterin synthase